MSSISKHNIIVINSSHYLPTGSGNKLVYKFQPSFNFSSNDKIGVQSLSIFNSFFNISEQYGNNNLTFTFPCHNPVVGTLGIRFNFKDKLAILPILKSLVLRFLKPRVFWALWAAIKQTLLATSLEKIC